MTRELTAASTSIIYEYPLNEGIRLCLRLETLFHQFHEACYARNRIETIDAMHTLLKIIELTDRPDIKSKISHMLTQYTNTLAQYKAQPQVNSEKLDIIIKKFQTLYEAFHKQRVLDESLRKNEFLYQIRMNASTPGGVSDCKIPSYYLWQQQSPDKKANDLMLWMEHFETLKQIVMTILQFTRDTSDFEALAAEKGFYHQNLNATQAYQMLRISLPIQSHLFPEFSAGKHRLTIRFLCPNYMGKGRPEQTKKDVQFQLSCCKI